MSAGRMDNCLIVGNKSNSGTAGTGAAIFADGSAVIRNCTFVSAPHAEGGVLKLGGRAHAYGLDIKVRRDPKLRQSAFAVRGACIDITDCRIRTDTGKGVCTVRSSSVPGYIASSVHLEGVTVASGTDFAAARADSRAAVWRPSSSSASERDCAEDVS